MTRYFAILWAAILNRNPYPDCVLIPRSFYEELTERVAKYDRRAQGQRKANERKKQAPPGPQEIAS